MKAMSSLSNKFSEFSSGCPRDTGEVSVDLSKFDNSWYKRGRSLIVQALWFLVGAPLFRCTIIPFSTFRVAMLRAFGARLGRGVVIKPGAKVKYPWHLSVGDFSWIGEDVWIDNLAAVIIGRSVCISQGAYLCTGNHNWSDQAFGLVIRPIILADGSWVGARSLVCPGVSLHSGAVSSAGSVITRDVPAFEIHSGNPARFTRMREVTELTAKRPRSANR
jgi:putative colanic acid biosynthesis acetyltransferase WcaF